MINEALGRSLSYLPVHEADWVHHSGLNDFPAREDPPRHSVGLQVGGVGQVPALHIRCSPWC